MINGRSPLLPDACTMTALTRKRLGATLVAFLAAVITGCAHAPLAPPVVPLRLAAIDQGEVEVDPHTETGHEGEFHPGAGSQAIGIFVGGSGDSDENNGAVLGLDYGYRLTDHVGIGAFAEGVAGHNRSFAAGVQAYYATPANILFFAGTGYELHHSEWEHIFRLGIEYEIITPSGWAFAPSIFYDFGETTNLVAIGVTFGKFL